MLVCAGGEGGEGSVETRSKYINKLIAQLQALLSPVKKIN